MALDPALPLANTTTPVYYTAEQWRRLDIATTMAHDAHDIAARAGVAGGFGCTVSGLTVSVAPGAAIITPAATVNGSYRVAAGTATALTLTARDGTLTRYDLIVLSVKDGGVDTSGAWEAALTVVTGTPATTPRDPAVTAGGLVLARAIVPATGDVTMVDMRTWASGLGGVIPCLSATLPTGAGLRAGQLAYTTDTETLQVWLGDAWGTVFSDTGWIDLTPGPNLTKYDNVLQGRRIGPIVYLRGGVDAGNGRTIANNAVVVTGLPAQLAPGNVVFASAGIPDTDSGTVAVYSGQVTKRGGAATRHLILDGVTYAAA